jgi:spore coat polysaccharide biosynthesis protein SpsF
MSSARLPGKTLVDLAGLPVIDHVVARARRVTLCDDFVVATSTDDTDDVLEDHLDALGVRCVRGSLDDVLSRYALAAERAEADVIVRITCDCPLIDPVIVDEVIASYHEPPRIDYCCNTLTRTYPIGMDTEVFSREALEYACQEAMLPRQREHVAPYLYENVDRFRLRNVEAQEWGRWPDLRLTVDEPCDLEFMEALISQLGPDAPLRTIVDLLRSNPDIVAINAGVTHRHIDKPSVW